MELCISIVNYNTRELLRRCLQTIAEHPLSRPYEVIVVDNDSHDGSVEMVRAEFPEVRVIASTDNLGYAAGNNLALRATHARYALVLNSDIELHAGALDRLHEFMEAHPTVGMSGARLILPDGSIQPSAAVDLDLAAFTTQQLLLDKAGVSRYLTGDYWIDCSAIDQPTSVEQVTGACMFCRREALLDVGLMDEGYWMYCEDSDWCRRFREHGWPIYYVPDAVMDHKLGGSSTGARAEMIAAYGLAAVRYFRRHEGPVAALAGRAVGLLGALLRLSLWTGLWLARRDEHSERQVLLFAKTLRLLLARPNR